MKKRIISLLTTLAMVAGLTVCLPTIAASASSLTYGVYEYSILSSTTAEITDYNGSATTLSIPSKINGYKITSIGDYAFDFLTTTTSITIPSTVKSIGEYAFYSCTKLTSLTIPSSVTSIGEHAFSSCNSLTTFTFPKSIKTISASVISNCESLTSVSMSNSVTSIEKMAFYGCGKLTDVTLSSSLKSIGEKAFEYCYDLPCITIPSTVKTIGSYAFGSCDSLTSITIPNSVTSIGSYAFDSCDSLTTAKIGSSVKTLGEGAFYGCSYLQKISIPSSVTSIEKSTFLNCERLVSVSIPESVTSIGDKAFWYCRSLTEVTIPNSVKTIGDGAFKYCNGLSSVTILNSVTSIADDAFYDCADDLTFYCYAGTYAQKYAAAYEIDCVLLKVTVPTVSAKSTYTCTTSAVRINWNKVAGATGYRIYRYNSTTKKWVKITTIKNGSTTTYRNSGLSAGTTYKYKVKAYYKINGVNYWGSASSAITTSTKPSTAKFTTASKTTTAICLNWKKVTGASGYQIQKYNSSTKKWSTVKTITSGSTLTYRISGLKKGTVYKYRIRAYRTVNGEKLSGAWSATKKVTTKS
ncbi:MAG: fibronectin type III domain-containing protein [Ruminococcus sp.]|nr:fibronectin type III domain-containing protein [Ruminococcus sp.]